MIASNNISMKKRVSQIIVIILLTGCQFEKYFPKEACDNQKNLDDEAYNLVNPLPFDLNYKKINDQHKVLVAVLGSGVDYNHPFLKKRMHYTLDANDQLFRLGWDYVANDDLPSPYIAREIQENDVNYTRLQYMPAVDDMFQQYYKHAPSLGPIINPLRNHLQEYYSKAGRTTAEAGLIAQYDKRIGLLPYRYSPVSHIQDGMNYTETKLEQLFKSIKKSIRDNATVINISEHFYQSTRSIAKISEDTIVPILSLESWKKYQKKFEKIVEEYSDILFIVSTGDNYNFINMTDEDSVNFPCGISSSNILCVGALDKKGNVLQSSNVPNDIFNTVYAIGENLNTAYPTNMCGIDGIKGLLASNHDALSTKSDTIEGISKTMAKICSNDKRFFRGRALRTGTGFSTALVSNLAAKIIIKNKGKSPKWVIKKIISLSEKSTQNVNRIIYSKAAEIEKENDPKYMFELEKIKNKKVGKEINFDLNVNILKFDYHDYKEHKFNNIL